MNEFIEVMREAGLNPPPTIQPSNKFIRFSGIGKNGNNKAGFCLLFKDGNGGVYGDFSSALKEKWQSQEVRKYSPEKQAAHKAMVKDTMAKAEREQKIEYEKAGEQAQETFNSLPEAKAHEYLKKKKVKSYGLRIKDKLLVIPLYNEAGTMTTYQTIAEDGQKIFFYGGKKKGSSFPIPGNTETVFICEGYSTGASIYEATGNMVLIAFDAGNILNIAEVAQKKGYQRIVVGADNDNAGIKAAEQVLKKYPEIKYIVPPNEGQDWNDYFQGNGTEATKDKILSLILEPLPESVKAADEEQEKKYKSVDIKDFVEIEFSPRENILTPWLPAQGLSMVHAYRGCGKTFFALYLSIAIASGGKFLKWEAPKPKGVLYIDGEMPAVVLQDRMDGIIAAKGKPTAPYKIITPDLQENGMPNLAEASGQEYLKPHLEGVSLIIVDNIATLCRGGVENKSESWSPVQEWALRMRSAGISILFVHHDGKNLQQRGASSKEDILDTVIALKHPFDYAPDQGARFEVHFEKSRGIYGDDVKPFEAWLKTEPGGGQEWQIKDIEENKIEKVADYLKDGIPQNDIAELMGITKGTVSKYKKKASYLGLLRA